MTREVAFTMKDMIRLGVLIKLAVGANTTATTTWNPQNTNTSWAGRASGASAE